MDNELFERIYESNKSENLREKKDKKMKKLDEEYQKIAKYIVENGFDRNELRAFRYLMEAFAKRCINYWFE